MPQTVCVTGASGYIASHIVKQLLEKGHAVRATVRDPSKPDKYKFLTDLPGADERLTLHGADLLEEGSFDEAVSGADTVMHTASPFIINAKGDPQKVFIEPAVQGTKNVLTSVGKADSVKRVVLTSSVAAMAGSASEYDHPVGPDEWNRTSTLSDGAYSLSKRMAEEAAWEMAKAQDRYTMVTIHPSLVIGPTLSGRADSASITLIASYINGKNAGGVAPFPFCYIDVRDVAAAHVLAMEKPETTGRFVVAGPSFSMLETANMIREKVGTAYPVPTRCYPKWALFLVGPMLAGLSWNFIRQNANKSYSYDASKTHEELGLQFRDTKESLHEMVECILDAGIVTRRT